VPVLKQYGDEIIPSVVTDVFALVDDQAVSEVKARLEESRCPE
jgi:hypothetical protein